MAIGWFDLRYVGMNSDRIEMNDEKLIWMIIGS